MESDWAQYFFQIDDQPASCLIDLAHAEMAPDQERPVCTLLRVPLLTPGDDGMGEQEEMERLRVFEDRFLVETAARMGLVMVASVRGGGQMDFWFYGPTDRAEEMLDAAAAVLEGYEVQGGSQEDPEWEQYLSVLYPDREAQRQIGDSRVLMSLLEAGDDGHVPRPIEHLAVFATREQADRFAAKLTEQGFRVDEVRAMAEEGEGGEDDDEESGESDAGWAVEFCNQSKADLESILPVTSLLEELAESCGGAYDGWQTTVITEE